jgi:hypothetical protein
VGGTCDSLFRAVAPGRVRAISPVRPLLLACAAALAACPAAASGAGFGDVFPSVEQPRSHRGAVPETVPTRYHAFAVRHGRLRAMLADGARRRGRLPVSLPGPGGKLQRFAVRRTRIMATGLAARHAGVVTYGGIGLDDRTARVRFDLTRLGLHATVRSARGDWFIDPYYRNDRSVYVAYRGRHLRNVHGPLAEPRGHPKAGGLLRRLGVPRAAAPGGPVQRRTYRLALLNDPSYARYFGPGGGVPATNAQVLAAKVVLVDRLNTILNDDMGIRLVLAEGTDTKLNLATNADMTGVNGPCGAAPCFTAAEATECAIDRSTLVLGQLLGARNYDVGHLVLGHQLGGVAYLDSVGGPYKGGGCSALSRPVGDPFTVSYLAHEIGHQFGALHTFADCGGSGEGGVEPGSGSTIMSYAGGCGLTDLQDRAAALYSQQSIEEMTTFVDSEPSTDSAVQRVSLWGFDGTDSFALRTAAGVSARIVRGTSYTKAAIEAAIEAVLPAGAFAFVYGFDGDDALDDTGFEVRFGGTAADTALPLLAVAAPSGVRAHVGEEVQGGPRGNGGTVSATGNRAPVVSVPAAVTIPARTPFTLTGSGTDPDGDALAYTWEQDDPGAFGPDTPLFSDERHAGPLFRVPAAPAGDPSRTFPDLEQILAGATNAATGGCVGAEFVLLDCYAEFLPTSAYAAGKLRFRLTARDRSPLGGGTAHADTLVTVAAGTGPFAITAPPAPLEATGGETLSVAWHVAGTDRPPIGVSDVEIALSADGGRTFPHVLAASTPNDGEQAVTLPVVPTTDGRIRVRALGNVFFDVSGAAPEVYVPEPPAPTPEDPAATPEEPAGEAPTTEPDRTPPAPPVVLTPTAGAVLREPTVAVSGTAEPGAIVTVHDDEGDDPVGTANAGAEGSWALSLDDVADGVRSFTTYAEDPAGNRSAWTQWRAVRVHTGPGWPMTGDAPRTVRAGAGAASLTFAVRCRVDSPVPCAGSVALPGLGAAPFAAAAGSAAAVTLALAAPVRRTLLEGGQYRIEPLASLHPHGETVLAPLVVRAPRRPAARAVRAAADGQAQGGTLRVTVAGSVVRPRSVPSSGCLGGRVLVELLEGDRTVAVRPVRTGLSCRYRAAASIRPSGAGRLRARATFLGNAAMSRRAGRAVPVR